jgi:uridine phosphorylase
MIGAAELPLNKRGAVYHLDLCPDEIADTIITVGDPSRVQQISQHFNLVELVQTHREFVTHTGYLGGKRISVISTGIGVPNIDIVLQELDALVNIDLKTRTPKENLRQLNIIRLGTAGGLQADCEPGQVFLSQYGIGFDTLLDYYSAELSPQIDEMKHELDKHLQGEGGQYYLTQADERLIQLFSPLGQIGITATCIGFFGPQGRKLRLEPRYPQLLEKLTSFQYQNLKVVNLEMETAAILGMGKLLGHKCLSLSVAINNRVKKTFVDDVASTVEKLIQHVLELVVKL